MKKTILILVSIIILIIFSVVSCNIIKSTHTKSPTFNSPISDGSEQTDSTASAVSPSSSDNAGDQPEDNANPVVVIESAEPNYELDKYTSSSGGYYYIPMKGVRANVVDNTKIVKENSSLSEGRIVYKIPDRMKVRSTYKVLVRISKSKKTISVYEKLSGDVVTSTLPVTETMDVKLIDVSPDDRKEFNIIEINSSEQIVEDGDTYTEWSWDVTPIHVGSSKLKIIISVIRDKGKKDIVYEDTVIVEKDILVQIGFFLESYWQLLLTSIAIPFIVFLYKRRKEKEKKRRR